MAGKKELYYLHSIEDNLDGTYNYVLIKEDIEDIAETKKKPIRSDKVSILEHEKILEGSYVFYDRQSITSADDSWFVQMCKNYGDRLINSIHKHELLKNKPEPLPFDYCSDNIFVKSYHVNVGHGNCSIIVFKRLKETYVWMVDCSIIDFRKSKNKDYSYNLESCIEHIKKEFDIKDMFISKLFITHCHFDHYNGISYLIDHKYINEKTEVWMNIFYPDKKQFSLLNIITKLKKIRVKFIIPNYKSSIQNVKILYPDIVFDKDNLPPKNKLNNASIVYKISLCGKSMLFPGDIETDGWKQIARRKCYINGIDYFCISHHGSINGHIVDKSSKDIPTVKSYIPNTQCQILMGRNNAFPGIFSKDVTDDFKGTLKKTDKRKLRFIELNWNSGRVKAF